MHLSHEYTFFFLQNPRSLLPRFKSRSCCSCVTSGQTVVQKEPCKMSHEKQGLPCFVVLVPCSDQAEPPAKLAPHCCRLVRYSQLLVHTRPALPTMSRWGDCGDRVWQSCLHPCLPHCHPQGWPWSLGSVCPWCSLVEFCCALRHRRIEPYLDCILEESSFKSVQFALIRLSKYYGKVSLGQIKIYENIIWFLCSLPFSSRQVHISPFPKKVTSIKTQIAVKCPFLLNLQ